MSGGCILKCTALFWLHPPLQEVGRRNHVTKEKHSVDSLYVWMCSLLYFHERTLIAGFHI